MRDNSKILLTENNNTQTLSVLRITALWAFSESAFGGILHALTVPLRGIFINAAAVLFISLIALFSKSSKEILKSTLIVILIKALVSPHFPHRLLCSINSGFGWIFIISEQKLFPNFCIITRNYYFVFFRHTKNSCAYNSFWK